MRGAEVTVMRKDLPIADDRMFITDIIGLTVKTDDGKEIGVLTDVLKAHTDVFVLKTKKGELMFPSVKGIIKDVDFTNGAITLYAERFAEVSSYED